MGNSNVVSKIKSVLETSFWIVLQLICVPLSLLPLAPLALLIYGVVKLIRDRTLPAKLFSLMTDSPANGTHLSIWAISGYRVALILALCLSSGWIMSRLILFLGPLAEIKKSNRSIWFYAVIAIFTAPIIAFLGVLWLAGSFGLVVVIVASVGTWPVALSALWTSLISFACNSTNRSILTVASLLFGILLYVLRRRVRIAYAAAEMVVGVAACWAAFADAKPDQIAGPLVLAGGLYVIVRGCDNAIEGWRGREARRASAKMERAKDRGEKNASEDIKAGQIRIVGFRDQWPPDKPPIDEDTGLDVQLLDESAFGKAMMVHVEAYNNTMREWHVMKANPATTGSAKVAYPESEDTTKPEPPLPESV
jgi:energy-converting hydrogenase Eha subunit A